jgi:predicted aconitase
MHAGAHGPAVKAAIEHQIKVGEFFGAEDFVPVTQAHIMADTESLGEAGVQWLESLTRDDPKTRVRVPTIMDPRGTDFSKASVLKHPAWILDLERRAIEGFKALGILMTDTCINYQTIQAPARGESVAFGDTGVVIYCNSVCGARSNFAGGRPHRPHAALRLPPGRDAPGDAAPARRLDAGHAQRLGRARRPHRPARRQLLGGAAARGPRLGAAFG